MKKNIFLYYLTITILSPYVVFSQSVYLIGLNKTLAKNAVTKFDIQNFDGKTVCFPSGNQIFNDVGFHSDGNLYAISNRICKIDTSSGAITYMSYIPSPALGLVSNLKGTLFLAGGNLMEFSPTSNQILDLGLLSYPCAGDLTFWNGKLMMTSSEGRIIEVNIQNPALSPIYMTLPETHVAIATVWDCVLGKNRTFACGASSNQVLEIDFENKKWWVATDKFISGAGASSLTEFQASGNNVAVLDTLVLTQPDCGQTNGTIQAIPDNSQIGQLSFSLDGKNWQPDGNFTNLPGGAYNLFIKGGNCIETGKHQFILNDKDATPIEAIVLANDNCKNATGKVEVKSLGTVPIESYSIDSLPPQTGPVFQNLQNGFHQITATDADGCRSGAYVFVPDSNTAYVLLFSSISDTTPICGGTEIKITAHAPENTTFEWFENGEKLPGMTGDFLKIIAKSEFAKEKVIYQVLATDASGCTAETNATFEIQNCSQIPNAFTPNGDGTNDTFGSIENLPGTGTDLRIFNRWGQEVFRSSAAQNRWDGSSNGHDAPSDVYVYKVVLTLQDGTFQNYAGEVTLLR